MKLWKFVIKLLNLISKTPKLIIGKCLLILKIYKEANLSLEKALRFDSNCVDAYFY